MACRGRFLAWALVLSALPVRAAEATPPPPASSETFDPESLNEELLLIEPVKPTPAPGVATPAPAAELGAAGAAGAAGTSAPQAPGQRVFGWRILLDQFTSAQEADHLRREALLNLERADVEVTFVPPWHRVELGHFRTEADAQETLTGVQWLYRDAIKVRGQIVAPGSN